MHKHSVGFFPDIIKKKYHNYFNLQANGRES